MWRALLLLHQRPSGKMLYKHSILYHVFHIYHTVVCFEILIIIRDSRDALIKYVATDFFLTSEHLLPKKSSSSFLGIICMPLFWTVALFWDTENKGESVLEEIIQSVKEQQRKGEYKTGSGLRVLIIFFKTLNKHLMRLNT